MDTSDVMISLYDVIDEIKESTEYKALKESYNNLLNDNEASLLVDDFNHKKELYNTYPSKENIKALSSAKKALYSNKFYKIYSDNLLIYNTKISKLEKEINIAIFGDNLEEFKNLFHERGGCIK